MNQNRNNLIVVDFDSTQLDINYLKYFLQNLEKFIMPLFSKPFGLYDTKVKITFKFYLDKCILIQRF